MIVKNSMLETQDTRIDTNDQGSKKSQEFEKSKQDLLVAIKDLPKNPEIMGNINYINKRLDLLSKSFNETHEKIKKFSSEDIKDKQQEFQQLEKELHKIIFEVNAMKKVLTQPTTQPENQIIYKAPKKKGSVKDIRRTGLRSEKSHGDGARNSISGKRKRARF